MSERYIPVSVKRRLRQEALFGCAACGSPLLDYHHIVPWSERQHNDPEHMVALCPTHHRSLGKLPRKKSYDLKKSPHNRQYGIIRGYLGTEASIDRFVMGTNTYINTPNIINFFGQRLISYRFEDGQFLLSVYIPGDDWWPNLKIIDNDMHLNRDGAWDFEFRTNYLKLKRKDGTFFEIDIRGSAAFVAGDIKFRDIHFQFNNEVTLVGSATLTNCRFESCGGGISYGSDGYKIHWPNYAMVKPTAYLEKLSRGR